jgi:hypothetical protein
MLKLKYKDICQACRANSKIERGSFCDTHHLIPLKAAVLIRQTIFSFSVRIITGSLIDLESKRICFSIDSLDSRLTFDSNETMG